jgi:hypothetical protein
MVRFVVLVDHHVENVCLFLLVLYAIHRFLNQHFIRRNKTFLF